MTSEKENPWSEDETDTSTTTEANEPIEVDDDVSHEASENKESISIGANNTITAGWDNFKTSSFTIGMQLVQITRFIASRIAQNCLNCWKSFLGRGAPILRPNGPLLLAHLLQKLGWSLPCQRAMWAFAITWRPSSVNLSHFNLLLWYPQVKWSETW